ncbi:hypothetical protein DRE_03392 [Drechslerella stenobrocha 248]|uniref:NADP-dependent oxidoreductase domain-containing protein n=1 Tax=Drechslerella stenobrocha 248 TaxID=1043628 RepID=W7I519_9PEZI|nr:hypothetical protein DRE_03392 [Drechslerella stenobrocha 248]
MSSSADVALVYGGFGFAPDAETGEYTEARRLLDVLTKVGVKTIDTAQIYNQSEDSLGKANTERSFIIDTKIGGAFSPGSAKADAIVKHGTWAGQTLGPIDVYYLHSPDESVPFEEQLLGMQQLYEAGVFKRLGLSNFTAEQVQKVYDITVAKGWVKPTVFQGNYNAFARTLEDDTFPTLRKLGISFYAYSPLAGGLLAKTKEQFVTAGGRWEAGTALGDMYRTMYGKAPLLEALDEWNAIATKEGVTRAELGYRWARYHSILDASNGDAVIFGAFTAERITETVNWLNKGPLSDEAANAVNAIWANIKDSAPRDNYHSYAKENFKA